MVPTPDRVCHHSRGDALECVTAEKRLPMPGAIPQGAKTAGDTFLVRKGQEETRRDSERQLLPAEVLYLHRWCELQGSLRFLIFTMS